MSADALPYTLLILLAELAIGGMWLLWLADLRGQVAPSFVKFAATLALISASFTFWVAAKMHVPEEVDGYPLAAAHMPAARVALALLLALALAYMVLALSGQRKPRLAVGAAASAAGLGALTLLAQVFALPTWGYAGTLLSLIVGGLVVGSVSMGMVLGHWYLVTPRLSEQPLREMTLLLLVVLGIQGLLLIPALALPRDTVPNAIDTPILQNPFFWLRVGGGLAFPMLLSYMAYDSSGVRAMQSATGLLYLAMGLVLSGEVLAKGLLFVTAVPN